MQLHGQAKAFGLGAHPEHRLKPFNISWRSKADSSMVSRRPRLREIQDIVDQRQQALATTQDGAHVLLLLLRQDTSRRRSWAKPRMAFIGVRISWTCWRGTRSCLVRGERQVLRSLQLLLHLLLLRDVANNTCEEALTAYPSLRHTKTERTIVPSFLQPVISSPVLPRHVAPGLDVPRDVGIVMAPIWLGMNKETFLRGPRLPNTQDLLGCWLNMETRPLTSTTMTPSNTVFRMD